jgi:hypothetical protein
MSQQNCADNPTTGNETCNARSLMKLLAIRLSPQAGKSLVYLSGTLIGGKDSLTSLKSSGFPHHNVVLNFHSSCGTRHNGCKHQERT